VSAPLPEVAPTDIAIVNGTVMPMGGAPPIAGGTVMISGRTIAAVGPAGADTARAAKVIDATDCVVMPGFANCHTHIASNQLLRGLLDDVRIFEWLKAMWQLKSNFDEETLYFASLNGLIEMVKSGITTFNEHFDAYRVEPEIEALKVLPLRATLGYGFANRGIYASITDWSWKTLGRSATRWRSTTIPARADWCPLSPHAVYSSARRCSGWCARSPTRPGCRSTRTSPRACRRSITASRQTASGLHSGSNRSASSART
jgi:5-methylthioadenosine/S-adenosylhomocysteine deaminase